MSRLIFEIEGENQQAIQDRAFVLIGDLLTIKQERENALRKELRGVKGHKVDYHPTDNGHKGIVTVKLDKNKAAASEDESVKEAMKFLKKENDVENVHLEDKGGCLIM